MSGLVSLIGSGPGNPDLITRKAIDRLRRADIVFHDKLSPNELIETHCPEGTLRRDVGKRKGKVGPNQNRINTMLVEAARQHNRVVRLKGGDPYLFGRGGEEAEHLARHGIDFEVIPGVSSLLAAPAYAGVPLTHREHASNLGVITGHFDPDEDPRRYDWEALASMDTLVVVMGITQSAAISARLIDAGMAPGTPALLVGWGTTPRQRSRQTTLGQMREGLDQLRQYLPGLIVIGEVVRCRRALNWFEAKPLFRRTILVTRPREQAERLAARLREQGAHTITCPSIEIAPSREGLDELARELEQLERYDWVVFTSRNGVRFFFQQLTDRGWDARRLSPVRIACIGDGTADRLRRENLHADLLPQTYRAESLAEALLQDGEAGDRLLLPRAGGARPLLADQLREHGREVREIQTYRAQPATGSRERWRRLIDRGEIDLVTFTSSSTVEKLFELVPDREALVEWLGGVDCAAIGPITASTLREHGVEAAVVPDQYNLEQFQRSIVEYYQRDSDDPVEVSAP